jgi:hypothetical protein
MDPISLYFAYKQKFFSAKQAHPSEVSLRKVATTLLIEQLFEQGARPGITKAILKFV